MNSTNLRSNIDGILQQTSNDQRKQVEATNLAFSKRIAECKDTKGKLEDHLNKVRVIQPHSPPPHPPHNAVLVVIQG